MPRPWEDETSTAVTKTDQSQVGMLPALANSFSQGATWGYSDEAAAAAAASAKSPFSEMTWRDIYEQQLEQERANLSAGREQHPYISFMGETAGAIGSGFGVGKLAAKFGPQFISKLPNLARLMGIGAVEGAAYGSGTAEEGERLSGAGTGAMIGAAAGPIAGGVAYAGKRLLQPLANVGKRIAFNTPKTQAARAVIERLKNDGLSPVDAIQKLTDLGPDAVLGDLGPNMRGAVKAVSGMPGAGRRIAEEFLETRHAGQDKALLRAAGLEGGESKGLRKYFFNFINSKKTAAAPLFDEVVRSDIQMTPRLKEILSRPGMKAPMRRAAINLADAGDPATPMRLIKASKEKLDDIIRLAIKNMKSGKGGAEARSLTILKNDLLDEIDTQLGKGDPTQSVYRQAREMFSSEENMKKAMALGRNLFKKTVDLDEAEMLIENMSASERHANRIGVLRGIVDVIDTSPDVRTKALTLIRKDNRMREVIRMAFPDDKAFDEFIKEATARVEFGQTRGVLAKYNSQTEPMAQEIMDLQRGASAFRAATYGGQDHLSAAVQLLQNLGFGELSPETLEELTNLLFSRGAGLFALKKAAAKGAQQALPRLSKDLMSAGAGVSAVEQVTNE